MKKVLCIIFVLLLIPVMSFATDFSGYSDAELLELQTEINNELIERNVFKKAELSDGRYEIGADIPAGRYTIDLISQVEGAYSSKFGAGYINDESSNDYVLFYFDVGDPSQTVTLKKGWTLIIKDGTFSIKVANSIEWE